jgi:Heterokaryon incompatibility protein (HET)
MGCYAAHEDCRMTIEGKIINEQTSPPVLPTRVVELFGNETIRLVETGGKLKGKWIALTHCWADPSNHPPKTTKDTRQKWMSSVSIADLPQTFPEAICLAASLGIRYVWIDSLCIIQYNREDSQDGQHL